MKRSALALLICGLSILAACGDRPPERTSPRAPRAPEAAEPVDRGDVIAVVELPSQDALDDAARAFDLFQPGGGALLKAQLPGLLQGLSGVDLGAADLSRPIAVVMVNPKKYPQPFALLVHARDAAGLKAAAERASRAIQVEKDRALIGPADVVVAAKPFAFSALGEPPKRPRATIYVRALMAVYGTEFDAAVQELRGRMSAQSGTAQLAWMIDIYESAVRAVATQTDRVEVTVAEHERTADLLVDVHPIAESAFAGFVIAQEPSRYTLAERLPTGMVIALAGTFRAGPARDAMMSAGGKFMISCYGSDVPAEALAKVFETWITALDGEMAMVMANPLEGTRMQMLLGTTSADAMRTAWRELMTLFAGDSGMGKQVKMMGIEQTVTFKIDALVHAKTSVDRYTTKINMATVDPALRPLYEKTGGQIVSHFAVLPDWAAMTMGDKDAAMIRHLIDTERAARGSLDPHTSFAKALATSRSLQESLLLFMDTKQAMASATPFSAVSIALGKRGRALGVRMSFSFD